MRAGRLISMIVGLVAMAAAVVLVVSDEGARGALGGLSVTTLALVLGLQAVNVVADSIRYRMVLPARFRESVGRWRWHRIFAVGRLLNSVIPQAGMAYRAAHLRVSAGLPLSAFFGSVAAVSWLGNGVVLIVAGLVVLAAGSAVAGAMVGTLGLAILVLMVLLPRLRRSRHGATASPLSRALAGFAESFVELGRTPGRLRSVLAVSLVTQAAGATAFIAVCSGLAVPDPVVTGVVLYAATTVITVISLTPGGIGVTELAAGMAGGLLDAGAAVGVLVALVIRVTGLTSVGVLAGVSSWLEDAPTAPTGDPR